MLKTCRRLHNWLGLLLLIQLLFWFLSGLIMAVMPIQQVRGEHLTQLAAANWQQARISPQQVLHAHSNAAQLSLTQRVLEAGTEPVYQVKDGSTISRYSAITAAPLAALSEHAIRTAAAQQYRGDGTLSSLTLLSELPQEVQQLPAPLWQLRYDDSSGSVLYLDPNSGSVLRVRTDGWRLFDFFWMLHIMDYDTRHNFNNPLLISFSALALLFTLTGMVLLWQHYRPKRRTKTTTTPAPRPVN